MTDTLKDRRFKIWIAFLTFLSGFINVGAIRSFSLPISHHTGNVSHLALSIAHKNITEVFIIASAILAFFAGAFFSGLLFHAMFIFYGDILVRTTHITGYLTDAAFALAMCLRGKKDKFRFFLFYSLNILFFLAGGITAGLIKIGSFFISSACLYLIAGLYYFMMRKKRK